MRSIRGGTGRKNKFDCRLSNPTKSLPITEQGIAMLSSVPRSKTAIQVNSYPVISPRCIGRGYTGQARQAGQARSVN